MFAKTIRSALMILGTATAMVVSLPLFSQPASAAGEVPASFADLVEKLTPAVVNISTTQKVKRTAMRGFHGFGNPQMDEQFRDFFERMLPPGAQSPFGDGSGDGAAQEVFALGSGFIIDPAGYVVTNNHVIADAEEIKVILSDNTRLEATLVGKDSKTDLALLKVKTDKKLPAVKWGESSTARVGDWVIAIGNPFGLGGTVTAGIISARSRNINAGPFDDFIQTDAAINRGNSGGPLFNANGEVIGVNSAIFSPSGGNIGIGFAVPEEIAKTVIAQLKEHGRTFRGWLGVKIQEVTDEMAESMGIGKARGALVMEVADDGPATKAGIKVGDVIVKFDGKHIGEMRELPRMVAETKIGKEAEIVVLRDGKEKSLRITLGELKEDEASEQASADDDTGNTMPSSAYETLGMSLVPLDGEWRTRFNIDKKTEGLLVIAVTRGSEAEKRGIARGDVITHVNDAAVASIDGYKNALKSAKDAKRKHALLRLWRESSNLFVTIPTDETKARDK